MSAVQQVLMIGGGSVVTPTGALVRTTVNDTSPSVLNWDTDVYDVGNWHDTVTNNSRLTVPSGVALVRVTGGGQFAAQGSFGMQKNAAAFRGQGYKRNGTGACQTIASGVAAASPGDYFELTSTTNLNAEERSWASIEKLDAATKYALVYRSGTLALGAGSTVTIGYDTEVADTDSWHDNVTNNSRLTVPSGVTRVRISAGIDASSNTGQVILLTQKNGANFDGLIQIDQDAGSSTMQLCLASPILEVTAGDYFTVLVQAQSARTLQASESTWFCIEEVPDYSRAMVKKSGSQAFTTGVAQIVTWDAETYDNAAIHDNVTNNSRLTVPSGITQARVIFSILTPSAAGAHAARTLKNGAVYYGMLSDQTDTSASDGLHGFGPWLDVTPGDYFELEFTAANNFSLGASVATWFAMECR